MEIVFRVKFKIQFRDLIQTLNYRSEEQNRLTTTYSNFGLFLIKKNLVLPNPNVFGINRSFFESSKLLMKFFMLLLRKTKILKTIRKLTILINRYQGH
jgi:hypothetical protein